MFDFRITFERKNPLAVIEAFRRTFSAGAGASLVIKCTNHGSDPNSYARLLGAAADHPDAHIFNRHLPADKKNAMIAACDCYIRFIGPRASL